MSDHLSSGSDGEIVVNPETPAMDIDDSSSGSDEEIFDQPESLKGCQIKHLRAATKKLSITQKPLQNFRIF